MSEKEIKEDIIDEYDNAGVWKDSIEDFIYYLLNERKPEYTKYCGEIEKLIQKTIKEYNEKYK